MAPDELEKAGFLRADWLPAGTAYERGDLYVNFTPQGSFRLFYPIDSDAVEISSGDLFDPTVHYHGPALDAEQLQRFLEGCLA